jgi:hypothetical protein
MTTSTIRALGLAAALGLGGSQALAQVAGQPAAPNMPAPNTTIPEKVDPPLARDPGATGSTNTLSERLENSEGVIRPPSTAAPDMRVAPPVPNPGTTPVITPPGEPGGSQAIQPR